VDTARGFVHVQDCGTSERVLAFVTITSFGGVLLDRVLPLLAQRGYRALALDLMGYGLSDKRTDDWSVADFADNVLDAIALTRTTPGGYVFGHFSGLIGLEVGARRPAGLRGLVLDGTPLIDAQKQQGFVAADLPPPTDWTEDGAHAVAFWKRAYGLLKRLNPDLPLAPQPPNKIREAYLQYLAVACFEPGTAVAYHTFDARKRMRDVDIKTLVMCSDTDWNLPHHRSWVEGLANSSEVRFKGVHPLHQLDRPERADEYVDVIDRFFAPLW